MRLSEQQANIICETTQRAFGTGVRVWLFGSRANDQARGGDIDLLIERDEAISLSQLLRAQVQLETQLQLPVDLITLTANKPATPIANIARLTGVRLA
ncbi:MAG TPA: nucleotidyltransferase domain-containing protein [bacterium]|nr:nucleotidyltransferase domain-containing protein [bacterium]